MKWRLHWYPWGPLCCGLIAALLAVYLMQVYIEQQLIENQADDTQPVQNLQRGDVVVANQLLQPGDTLALPMMSVRQLPLAGVATDTLHPSQAAWLVGQRLAHPVQAGQPIQRLHLQSERPSLFSSLLQPGQRALTLNVSAQQSHAGLIEVGDQVDFYDLSGTQPKLLDTQVKVIATGGKFNPDTSKAAEATYQTNEYRTLTFAIAAAKTPVYDALQRGHQLAFWLRSPVDQLLVMEPPQPRQIEWIIGGMSREPMVAAVESPWL